MDTNTAKATIKTFRESYTGGWGNWPDGGEITPNSIASGFWNCDAEIDEQGDVWLGPQNCWVDADQLVRFAAHLVENGNVEALKTETIITANRAAE